MTKNEFIKFAREIQAWAFWTILASIFFVVVGDGAPRLYWENIDTANYYSIESPVKTDKEIYKKGSAITLSAEKRSKINVQGSAVQELILLQEDGQKVEVAHTYFPAFLEKGNEIISIEIMLPKDLASGNYRWQGIISYEVHNVSKSATWYSDIFRVK